MRGLTKIFASAAVGVTLVAASVNMPPRFTNHNINIPQIARKQHEISLVKP